MSYCLQGEELQVIFPSGAVEVEGIWEVLLPLFLKYWPKEKGVYLEGRKTELQKIQNVIKRTRGKYILLNNESDFSGDIDMSFNDIGDNHGLLMFHYPVHNQMAFWDEWMNAIIAAFPIVQAWVVNSEYSGWQDTYDIFSYQHAGKDYSRYKLISNGKPFPLERTILDISMNPGRRIIRQGYVETVGSVMWLGEAFWPLVHKDPSVLNTIPEAEVTECPGHTLRVQVLDHCFVDESTADLQNRLRSALFPIIKDNWPAAND